MPTATPVVIAALLAALSSAPTTIAKYAMVDAAQHDAIQRIEKEAGEMSAQDRREFRAYLASLTPPDMPEPPASPATPKPHPTPASPATPAPHPTPASPATPKPHPTPASPATPAPHPAPGSLSLRQAGVSATLESQFDQLAQCESSGNWQINTGNSYSGGLQFHPATWSSHGGGAYAPEAHQASREEQMIVAKRVLDSQGWGAWPACSARLGLR